MVKKAPAVAATDPDAPQAPGYYRNTGGTELTILGPSMTVAIGPARIGYVPFPSRHRDLEAATDADFQAQEAADAEARAKAEAEDVPTDPTTSEE